MLFFSDLTSLKDFLVVFRSINVFDWLIRKKRNVLIGQLGINSNLAVT